jgi:hypothetical protein
MHLALLVIATMLAAAQQHSSTTGPTIPPADCSTEPGSCAMFNEMLAAKDEDFSGFQSKDFTAYVVFRAEGVFCIIVQQSRRASEPKRGRETASAVSPIPIIRRRSRARAQGHVFHLVSEQ